MKNTTLMTMATVIVMVILTTSVLVPVIGTAQDDGIKKTITLTNDGESLIEGNVSDTYNMQWDNALPGTIKINNPSPTVYFVAGTGATVSPESKTVVKDLTYGELPVPVKYGYSFDGWFSDEQYTTQIVSTDTVESAGNIFLYAKWTAGQYTVTFDADGGSVSPSSKTVTFGSAYGDLPVPEYTGHIFGGWVDANDNPITSQTIVSIGENHTLTAVWTLDQYLISFATDGHGTVDVPSVTVDFGTAYTISDNTITIGSTTVTATPSSGYSWSHWTPVNVSGTVGGAMTFIANFIQAPVTITFTAESPGDVSTYSIPDVLIGTQYTVSDNIVTISGETPVTATLPQGYYFTGWNIDQGSGTVNGSMTFLAKYEKLIVKDIALGDTSTWVLTTDGTLFGTGFNNYGQQGNGTTTNVLSFTHRLVGENVSKIKCSGDTTWAVTTDGKLFGCGWNLYGQQGDGATADVLTFTQRLPDKVISDVFCSKQTTWAITDNGELYGCGRGTGQGSGTTADILTFTQRLSGETISKVVCGPTLTWVLTTDGKIYGSGSNATGSLGTGDKTDVLTFTQQLSDKTITDIVLGGMAIWAITDNGELYGCGQNAWGNLGDGTTTHVLTFTQRLSGESVSKVMASQKTTWVITTDGKLYGCGENRYGQQGNGESGSGKTVNSFTQRMSDKIIVDGACCPTDTWVLTDSGELYGCGSNTTYQHGIAGQTPKTEFTHRFETQTLTKVVCSDNNTFGITVGGDLYGCGDGRYGEMGDGKGTTFNTTANFTPSAIKILPTQTTQMGVMSTRSIPLASPIVRSIQSPQISDTTYTYLVGGSDWMLCSMVTDQNENALVLYSEDLTEPLVWTDDLVILTFSNGVMAVEKDGTDYEISYTSIFFKGDGKYILLNDTAYVTESTPILGYAMTDDGIIGASGTMNSMTPFTMSGITLGDATAITEESEYDGAYLLSGVDIGYGSDSTASCTSIILPKSVNATETVENTSLMSLLWVIPIVVLAGIMIFVVRAFIGRYK